MNRRGLTLAILGGAMLAAPERLAAQVESGPAPEEPALHPVVSENAGRWVAPVLFVVTGLFVAAAMVGPVIRAEMPEEVPPAQSHDEPPGASGHHGPAGMVDTHPPEHEGSTPSAPRREDGERADPSK